VAPSSRRIDQKAGVRDVAVISFLSTESAYYFALNHCNRACAPGKRNRAANPLASAKLKQEVAKAVNFGTGGRSGDCLLRRKAIFQNIDRLPKRAAEFLHQAVSGRCQEVPGSCGARPGACA
jgi:hypothetical protein